MAKWTHKEALTLARHESVPVPIVADAAIGAEALDDGRMIPVLILDTSERPDIEQLVRAHEHVAPGDVDTTWMRTPRKQELLSVSLLCQFKRPVVCNVILEFPLPDNVPIVDLIVGAGSLYMQPGRPGDKVDTTLDHPKIIISVPSTSFSPAWDDIMLRSLHRDLQRRGLRRRDARRAASELMLRSRDLRNARPFARKDQDQR